MGRLGIALVLLAACSTHATDPSAGMPPLVVSPATTAAPLPAPAPPASLPDQRDPRSIRLPAPFVDPVDGAHPPMMLLAGEPASEANPKGTALVTEVVEEDGDLADTVSEWDLARAAIIRRTRLPVSATAARVHALRSPDAVRILASEYNGALFYLQLTPQLDVVARVQLGRVSVLGPNALATDGTLTVALADGSPANGAGGRDGLQAYAFDAQGKLTATRLLQRAGTDATESGALRGNLAVVDGRAYVLLRDGHDEARVEQLGADLRTLQTKRLPTRLTFHGGGRLTVAGGRLLAHVATSEVPLAVTLDLSLVTKGDREPEVQSKEGCGAWVAMDVARAALCGRGDDAFLDWEPLSEGTAR